MSITKFTTASEVRAIFGVSAKELRDTAIDLPVFETMLTLSIDEISPDVITLYDTIVALDPTAVSTVQAKFVALVKAFSANSLAFIISDSLAMFGSKRITDGKAEFERFDDVESIKASLPSKVAKLGLALANAFTAAGGSGAVTVTPTFQHIKASALAVDPVTNA